MTVRGRDVALNEALEGRVILFPDIVCIRGKAGVRTGKSPIKPRLEALLHSSETESLAPFNPIGLPEV